MDLRAVLKIIIDQAAAKIGGPLGWLYGKVLLYGGQAILDLINDWIRKSKRTAEQEKAKEVLEKVDKDPSKTSDDLGKAYEDYINSGRD